MLNVKDELDALAHYGFVVIEHLIDENRLRQAQEDAELLLESTPAMMPGVSGEVLGRMCKQLFIKSRAFDDLYVHPTVLAIARQYLGNDDRAVKLSTCMIKDVQPREAHRRFHQDDAFFHMPIPSAPIVLNTLWALDDFTRLTGATLVVPGSHKWDRPVEQDHEYAVVEMEAGSIVLFDGSLWYNNGSNLTHDKTRRALNVYYIVDSLEQLEGPHLGLNNEEFDRLPDNLKSII